MGFFSSVQAATAKHFGRFIDKGGKWLDRIRKRRSTPSMPSAHPEPAHGRPALQAPAMGFPRKDSPAPSPGSEVALPGTASISGALQKCAAGLKRICKSTEADFLDLGAQLQTIHSQADELTRKVFEVLSTDRNETIQSALNIIQEHAKEAMRELNEQRTKLSSDIAGLKATRSDLEALSNQNKNFKQIAKTLKMVGLNISIESARSEQAKLTFQALAEEINGLAKTVHAVAGQINEDTESAQQTIEAIQTEIGAHMQHLEGLLISAETMVQSALREVEGLMGRTMSILDGVGEKAGQIREQVGRLVVSVQIHDNISQRVAHINSCIEEALDIMQTSGAIDLPPPAMKAVFGRVYGINRLQTTHLKTIIADVAEVGRQSESALDNLIIAVRAVAQPEGLDFTSGGSVCRFDTSTGRHPVAVLRRALEQLLALFDEGLDGIGRLNAAREQTRQTVARMGQHIEKVRDINFEIHLKALNAVIKSTRLGSTGKAIESIVNEMKELAEQSNATIQSVAAIMGNIASASDSMDRNQSEEQEVNQAGRMLRKGMDDFSTACELFKQQSQEALERGARLGEKISQSRRKIGFFEEIAAVCQQQLSEMTRVGKLLQTCADAVSEEWIEEEQKILERYTMQREREAHRQAFSPEAAHGVDTEQLPRAPQQGNGTAIEEEFDANVELF
ncbi:MAG: hypothetical protein C4519_13790 [Desulfobacteraceae bacterium]|nr:MAG: hypothetical protein C4519_13790 [Desulfobacteraceae bacterium]